MRAGVKLRVNFPYRELKVVIPTITTPSPNPKIGNNMNTRVDVLGHSRHL